MKTKCPYCNKELNIDILRTKKESGFPIKYHKDCKNWILVGWDKKSCLKCQKKTELKDDGISHHWYCDKCSKETLIDAIEKISINNREEIIKFVNGRLE